MMAARATKTADIAAAPTGVLQRKCACGAKSSGGSCPKCQDEEHRGLLQRSATRAGDFDEVPPIVHEVLREPGQPLDVETRAFFEPRFGADFSGMRVHTGAKAAVSETIRTPRNDTRSPRSFYFQKKLAVAQTGDQYEHEADQIADRVMGMSDLRLHGISRRGAKMSAENEPKSEGETVTAPMNIQRVTAGVHQTREAPQSVHEVLNTSGQPLDARTRDYFEPRLRRDLSAVRVHTDASAADSATAVGARAYTVGAHVAFARGQFQPDAFDGRRLIAHELVHVAQQDAAAASGAATTAVTAAGGVVQRAPADSLGWFGDEALEAALVLSPIPTVLRGAAAASVRGFTAEVGAQFAQNSEAMAGRLKELKSFDHLTSLFGGYYGGLVAGIISPITGLFDMLVFADRLRVFVDRLAADAVNRFADLIEGAKALADSFAPAVQAVKAELAQLKAHPIDLIVSLVADQGPSKLEGAANQAGHDVVKSIAKSIANRYEEKKGEEKKDSEAAPLAQVDAKIEQLKDSLFSSTWGKIGYDIGYGVGFAVVNVLMLVFSGGVGNALTKLGSVLGELGGAIGKAGKLVAVVGRAITFVEEAINAVMNVAMKPLQPLLRALEPHLQKLVVFLRKMLGVAEKESAEAATAATKAIAATTKPQPAPPHIGGPHPTGPTPHAPASAAHAPTAQSPAVSHPTGEPHAPTAGAQSPAPHEPHLDPNEAKALERTRNVQHLDQGMIDDELKAARKLKSQPTTEPGYVEERTLPNGHTWRKKVDGTWCRFSGTPSSCVSPNAFVEGPGLGDRPPNRGRGSRQMSKDFAHDLGVHQGQEAAQADKLSWHFDNPRGISRTTQGFDAIYRDAKGNFYIVEFKGGTAGLSPGQMTNEWVNREIQRLEREFPGHPVVRDLRDALRTGRLNGRTYLTEIDPAGVPLPTTRVNHGAYSEL